MYGLVTLLIPFSYLEVKHPLKRVVDISFPVLGALTSGVWLFAWVKFNLFGQAGLLIGTNGLLQILSGFFITSLAAVATFNGTIYRIDEPLEGERAILRGDVLTRRQFLCFLFSYLAFTSLLLYLSGAVAMAGASTLHGSVGAVANRSLRLLFAVPYFAILSHLIGTTLIGLVFLAGRIPGSAKGKRFVASAKNSASLFSP